MNIRTAMHRDISYIAEIYEDIHTEEEAGNCTIGWQRGVYPTAETAEAGLERGDLFVMDEDGRIVGAAIINQTQVDVYRDAAWMHPCSDDQVMVLHTLVISPKAQGHGYGKAFVSFYEDYARRNHCPFLRMDTNCRNQSARALYHKLGYREIGIAPCVFNGIEGVRLVLLEKALSVQE